MINVAAILVVYKPNKKILSNLLKSVRTQVDNIIIIDNTEYSVGRDYTSLFDKDSIYIDLEQNYGIAHAQNVGIKKAKEYNSTHVLLLDQDSLLASDMIETLIFAERRLLDKEIKVAAVGPSFIDEKTKEEASVIQYQNYLKIVKVTPESQTEIWASYIIASGSLIRMSVLDDIGLMDSDLFIDCVDIDWGMRASVKGFESFVIPSVKMNHSIGDSSVQVGNRYFCVHSDMRNYFFVRNSIYISIYKKLNVNFRIITFLKTFKYVLLFFILSNTKYRSLKLSIIAIFDGIRKKMNKGYFI